MTAMDRAPLRLHGHAVSNYFNIAHAALVEKGAAFELVATRASQGEAFLALSPMGKIPVLETPEGWIAETVAILEYLEDTLAPPLHPQDAFLRARARQLINVAQVYLEVPARALYGGVFMGGRNSDAVVAAVRAGLDRGTEALRRLVAPRPYLFGERCGPADLFVFHGLGLVERLNRHVYDRSLAAEVPGLADWAARMAERDSSRAVRAAFEPAFAAYLADKQAAYPFERIDGSPWSCAA